jgi:hypothetical protein
MRHGVVPAAMAGGSASGFRVKTALPSSGVVVLLLVSIHCMPETWVSGCMWVPTVTLQHKPEEISSGIQAWPAMAATRSMRRM